MSRAEDGDGRFPQIREEDVSLVRCHRRHRGKALSGRREALAHHLLADPIVGLCYPFDQPLTGERKAWIVEVIMYYLETNRRADVRRERRWTEETEVDGGGRGPGRIGDRSDKTYWRQTYWPQISLCLPMQTYWRQFANAELLATLLKNSL